MKRNTAGMKLIHLIGWMVLGTITAFAQSAPGGIGNSDGANGQPELYLWLLPDSLGLSDGADVITWGDYSGKFQDLSAASATAPIFKAGGINGHDYLEFLKDNNRIVSNPFDMPTEAVSVFTVLRTTDSGDALLSYAVPGSDNEYLLFQSNDPRTYIHGGNSNMGSAYNDGNWKIFSHQWRNTDGRLLMHLDGTQAGSGTLNSGATLDAGGAFAIGGEQDAVDGGYEASQAFQGDIAEVIVYGASLKKAERTVVENYLAQKYGLDGNLPTDLYTPPEASYIVGMSGMGKESDGTTELNSSGLVITQNGNFVDGDYVFAAHDGTANAVNSTPNTLYAEVEAAWQRDWYVDKTGTVNVKLAFDFSTGIDGDYPANIQNYRLLYKSNVGDSYDTLSVAGRGVQNGDQIYFSVDDAQFSDGYYTLGTINQAESPVEGVAGRTWYTLISGDWDSWEVWTLDPSGSLPNNPEQLTPSTSSTSNADNVVILTGKTVTVSTNNKTHSALTVDGRLDFQSTSGHSFGEIKGRGRILLSGDNFPGGDATHFITAGQGEGTVEYYGTSFLLNQSLEFYDLILDMNDAAQTLTLLADYTVNGNLRIKQGDFQINDNTSTTNLNINVTGDVNVESSASISTGTGNARHQLNLYGDFTNNGTVAFTNRTSANYGSEAADGIVDVNFLDDSKSQSALLNGPSSFYRIEIDKGTDDTYALSLEASNANYFKLYGYAGENHGSVAQLTDNNNALGLIRGSVRIKSNIRIPVLNNTDNYNVSEMARLWVDGGFVAKNSGTAIVPYGKIQVSSGTLEARVNSGITTRGNGLVKVTGGTLTINQLRTSTLGASNVGGYVQSGGTTNILGGSTTADYYSFTLTYPGNVFNMSGGVLHIHEAHGRGGIFIASDETNYNVTGGTVIMEISDGNDFAITSTAPFGSVILRNSSAGAGQHILSAGTDVGATNEHLSAQPLVVLNDLTIESDAFLNHDGNDVTIGGDFSISENAVQRGDNNYGYLYDIAKPNTTTFNGDVDATFYIGHPDSEPAQWELYMNRLVLEKPIGTSLFIDSDTENDVYNVSSGWESRILRIDDIKVESGILNQTNYGIRLVGNVINYDQIGVYDGSTHDDAMIYFAWSSFDIETSDNAIFGNIKVNAGNNTISFSSDVYIKRMFYQHGKIYASRYNLKIDQLDYGLYSQTQFDWNQDGTIQANEQGVLSPNDMFAFDGNASDGGLSLKITGNGTYKFPIGIGIDATEFAFNNSKYTPAEINISNFADSGYITINPVQGELKTTDQLGGDLLDYYWRLNHEGFDSKPNVIHYFNYDDSDVVGNESGYYPGRVLDNYPYTRNYIQDKSRVDNTNNIIIYDDEAGNGIPLVAANYTAGKNNRFTGDVSVFYNKRNNQGSWGVKSSWFMDANETDAANKIPGNGDVVIIRGDYYTDNITVDGTREAAEIVFVREGTYVDIESLPRLRLETTDVLTVGKISGVGELYLMRTTTGGAELNADIGDFASNDTSVVDFYTTQNGTYDVNEGDFFTALPTLRIYGQNNTNRQVRFNYDMQMKNLVIDGSAQLLVGGNYTVEKRTRLGFTGDGGIQFPNGTIPYRFTTGEFVTGKGKNQGNNNYDLNVATGGGNSIEHVFEVKENIELDFSNYGGTLDWDFYTNGNDNNVVLKLSGEGNHSFLNGYSDANSTIEFYKIEMNKGVDQTSTFTFSDDFTLNGPTSGANAEKALIFKNGTLILDHPNINIDLTTGDDDFYIPGTAGLEVRQGQVNANGNSGILLDGKLEISGGTVDMSGGNNYIHYSASGNASIDVSSGSLIVGSQIRRGLTSSEGILKYTQTGGTVIVGNDAAPENDRGVFEVLNTNSNFRLTGGDLYIARAQTSPGTAALYLNPETSNVDAAATIFIGHTNTPANQIIGVYSTIDLPNLTIENSSNNNPAAQMWTIPLTINNHLDIQAGASFDANGLDLILNGDITANGAFVANNNTTFFSSNTTQQITGSPAFFNVTKNASGTLLLNNDVTTHNVFRHQSGVLSDNGNTLSVKGDLLFAGDHNWGGSGDGILMNGIQQQMLQGSGAFGKLSVDNSEGIFVPEGNPINIQGALQLENGVLDIGKNLLVLATNAEIIEGNVFSDQNMIQTNISFTDAGVKKFFPAIASADNFNFIYPIGSEGKYTPVSFSINEKDAGGYIRVKAANEMHPTILNDNEPCQEIHDTSNVLKYHWLLEASAVSNFTGSVNMNYYSEDFQLDNSKTGTSYTVADYITARLLLGSTLWNKYGPDSFDENSQTLLFDFTNTDDEGISGEYTAGIEDQAGSCEGAIPDEVPAYISKQDGDWNNIATWDTYPVSGGSIPVGGPRGAIVIVEHNVFVPKNYIVSYKTIINNTGLLDIGTSFGHRLGIVEGTGTLKLERGDLPAGVYDNFFSRSGGTIEFAGNTDYDILSEVSHVRNLKFSGTGERRFPNLDFEVYGLFTIDGTDATLEVINEHDRIMYLDSTIVFTQGTFDAGIGNAAVIINGTSQQLLIGNFIGNNGFWNLEMNNSEGLVLQGAIDIDKKLMFTQGRIQSDATHILTVTNTAVDAVSGYDAISFVDGPMRKNINSGDDFLFPVGDGDRYGRLEVTSTTSTGAAIWEAEYYNANASDAGLDTAKYAAPIQKVSGNEYWRIAGPEASSAAFATIRWDATSILPAATDNRAANLLLTEWNSGAAEWQSVGQDVVDLGIANGTVTSDAARTLAERYFTLASKEVTPLPTAGFLTKNTTICQGSTLTLSVQVDGNPNFSVVVDDGSSTTTYSSSSNLITFDVSPTSTITYTIVEVIENTDGTALSSTSTIWGDPVTVEVIPIPTNTFAITPSGSGSYCAGDAGIEVGLDGSQLGVIYQLLLDGNPTGGLVTGTGSAISFGLQTTAGVYTVQGVNEADTEANCAQLMTGSYTLSVDAIPVVTLTVNAGFDKICHGENTEISIAFTGTGPFDFTITNGTTTETVNNGGDDPFVYRPDTPPVWLDDGTPDTHYTYRVTAVTGANGCTHTVPQGNAQVMVYKIPETGPQYHISNEHAR
ncbi:MAG: hypothetical protein R6U66_01335 [Bacteroidales bacterium]